MADSTFIQKVLTFLKARQGRPISNDDIFQMLQSEGYPVTTTEELQSNLLQMQQQGFIYPSQGYWYPTYHSLNWGAVDATKKSKDPISYYTNLAKKYKTVVVKDRAKFVKEWDTAIRKYYEFFQENHPEYKLAADWLNASKPNFEEFVKDVMAILLGMNMKHPEIAYEGETYNIPEGLVTLEHAMNESMQRLAANMKDYSDKVIQPKDYRVSYDKVSALADNIQDKFIAEVVERSPAGTVISESKVKDYVTDQIKSVLPKKISPDLFFSVIITKLSQVGETEKYGVFLFNTKNDVIVDNMRYLVLNGTDNTSTWNWFAKTGSSALANYQKIADAIWTNLVADNVSFGVASGAGLKLGKVSIKGSSFNSTVFDNADFTDASITGCSFINCSLKDTVFKPSKFENNKIKGADFEGAVVAKNIKWEENKGTPKNIVSRDISFDKDELKDITKGPRLYSHAFPLEQEDEKVATDLAYSLKAYLDSIKLFGSLKLGLQKIAVDDTTTQLRTFLEDNSKVPTFDYGGSLIKWLVNKNKQGELEQAGFTKKEVNSLFGAASNIERAPKKSPAEEIKERRERLAQTFATTYGGKESLPKDALLGVIKERKDGSLYQWVSSLPDRIPFKDIMTIYSALVVSLRQSYVTPAATVTRRYQPMPYVSRMSTLKDEHGSLAGPGTQFGVGLMPIYALMPPDVADDIKNTMYYGGSSHMTGVFAFSRVFPMIYTEFVSNSKKKVNKKVWVISEMQSDTYQKAGKSDEASGRNEEGNERRNVHKKKYPKSDDLDIAMANLRSHMSNWSENLLNAIIEQAQHFGVSEVWMPRAAEVDMNNKGDSSDVVEEKPTKRAEFWWKYYDRAAKTFGGVLKNVGVQITLDPGGYSRKSSYFYVIPVGNSVKEASLKLGWQVTDPLPLSEEGQKGVIIGWYDRVEDEKVIEGFHSHLEETGWQVGDPLEDALDILPWHIIEKWYYVAKHNLGVDKESSLKFSWLTPSDPKEIAKFLTAPVGWKTGYFLNKRTRSIIFYAPDRDPNNDYAYFTEYEKPIPELDNKQLKQVLDTIKAELERFGITDYTLKVDEPHRAAIRIHLPLERTQLKTPWDKIVQTLEDKGYGRYMGWSNKNIGGYSLIVWLSPNSRSPKLQEILKIIKRMSGVEPVVGQAGGKTRIYVRTPVTSSLKFGWQIIKEDPIPIPDDVIIRNTQFPSVSVLEDILFELDTATNDAIFNFLYEDRAEGIAQLKGEVEVYNGIYQENKRSPAAKAFFQLVQFINIHKNNHLFFNNLHDAFSQSYEPMDDDEVWNPLGTTEGSLKFGWARVPNKSDEELKLLEALNSDPEKTQTGRYKYMSIQFLSDAEQDSYAYSIMGAPADELDEAGGAGRSVFETLGFEKLFIVNIKNRRDGRRFRELVGLDADGAMEVLMELRTGRTGSLKLGWQDVPETANDKGISTNRGNVIWSEKFTISKGKKLYGTNKFIAYIEKGDNGVIGGVIDTIKGDTVWGDTYPSFEVAKKELQAEITAMKSNSDWWNEGGTLGSLKFAWDDRAGLDQFPWDEIKPNIKHHIDWLIENNRPAFPEVQEYVTDNQIAQWAYKTFFQEYNIPGMWEQDPVFKNELRRIMRDDFGYTLYGPPYIDWLYWMQKAWDDVKYFVDNQRNNIAPDMNVSDQELARDWLKLWQEEKQVPLDIQSAPYFETIFLTTIQKMFEARGLGDVLGIDYQAPQSIEDRTEQIISPDTGVNPDEGDIPVDYEGNPMPKEDNIWEGTNYKPPAEEPEAPEVQEAPEISADELLDLLSEAIRSGDTERADEIKRQLAELTSESSLKLGWRERLRNNLKFVTREPFPEAKERVKKVIQLLQSQGLCETGYNPQVSSLKDCYKIELMHRTFHIEQPYTPGSSNREKLVEREFIDLKPKIEDVLDTNGFDDVLIQQSDKNSGDPLEDQHLPPRPGDLIPAATHGWYRRHFRTFALVPYVSQIQASLKLSWQIQDDAAAIARDTQDAYSFVAFQMPYWTRLIQHVLDWGMNAEEAEEFIRSKYTRWLRDGSGFYNYEEENVNPREAEIKFKELLSDADERKEEIIADIKNWVASGFENGETYNTRTVKRREAQRQASLKFGWKVPIPQTKIRFMSYQYILLTYLLSLPNNIASYTDLKEYGSIDSIQGSRSFQKAILEGFVNRIGRGTYKLTPKGVEIAEQLKVKYKDDEETYAATADNYDDAFGNMESSLVFNNVKKGQENGPGQESGGQTPQETQSPQTYMEKGFNKGVNEETPQHIQKAVITYPTVYDIIGVHDDVIQEFGGLQGILAGGENRIDAAIGRMQSGFGDQEFYVSVLEKAAVLCHSIVSTHPFNDANKRTAFVAVLHFLHDNGFALDESDALGDIIIQVADNSANYEHLLQWLQTNAQAVAATHGEALKNLTWQVQPEEKTPLDPNIVLRLLQKELDDENTAVPDSFEQRFEYVYPLNSGEVDYIKYHLGNVNTGNYDFYYIAERNAGAESIYDLAGANSNGDVELIDTAFIENFSEIPGLERYSSLKLSWSENAIKNPQNIKRGDFVVFERAPRDENYEFYVEHIGTAQELLRYDYTGLLEEGLRNGSILPDTMCAHLQELADHRAFRDGYEPMEFVNVINELQKVEQKVEQKAVE